MSAFNLFNKIPSTGEVLSSLWSDRNPALGISSAEVLRVGSTLHSITKYLSGDGIEVPMLVCVGSQSSGKSSVVNSMLAMDILPTGNEMVTRSPLRLELVQCPEMTGARVEFGSYTDQGWNPSDVIVTQGVVLSLEDRERVLRNVTNATNRHAGTEQNISHQEINIRISSAHVPDIILIDLPGLTSVACTDRGQPADIQDQIEKMVGKYISLPETIIMAVMPARVDLEADPSFAFVKQFDPKGARTIGVLTKPDLMEAGAHVGTYLSDTCSQSLKVHHGYWVVRNRSARESVSMSITEGFASESTYFESHAEYGTYRGDHMSRTHLGTKNLSTALSKILVTRFRVVLPTIIDRVVDIQVKTKRELEMLGNAPPEEDKVRSEILHNYLMSFCRGLHDAIESKSTQVNAGLQLKEILVHFRTSVSKLTPFNTKLFSDQTIHTIIQHCEGNSMPYPMPPIEVLEACITNPTLDPFQDVRVHATTMLTAARSSLIEAATTILQSHTFNRFPTLVAHLLNVVTKECNRLETKARKQITALIEQEKAYVWTDDHKFHQVLIEMKADSKREDVIRSLCVAYFSCVQKVLAHSIPKATMFPSGTPVSDLRLPNRTP